MILLSEAVANNIFSATSTAMKCRETDVVSNKRLDKMDAAGANKKWVDTGGNS